uniref:Uncharacterized protein n=1 Tax=Acrobeloides nanus TaxID=290746 RepID=A0A914DU21_9BILA
VKHQNKLDGLILINSIAKAPSWYEWGREKLNVRDLHQHGITDSVVDFLIWHNFGTYLEKCNPDLIQGYREYFEQLTNPNNLAAFLESYLHRKSIEFPYGPCGHGNIFIVPILQIVGERIYSLTDVEYISAKLDIGKNELVRLADCGGRILDERPDKVIEIMMLFLQGLGFFPSINVHDVLLQETGENNENYLKLK